jgi:hypothetical protein
MNLVLALLVYMVYGNLLSIMQASIAQSSVGWRSACGAFMRRCCCPVARAVLPAVFRILAVAALPMKTLRRYLRAGDRGFTLLVFVGAADAVCVLRPGRADEGPWARRYRLRHIMRSRAAFRSQPRLRALSDRRADRNAVRAGAVRCQLGVHRDARPRGVSLRG